MAYTSFTTGNYIFRLSTPVTGVPFSMSAWIYPTNNTANNNILALNSNSGNNAAGITAEGNISGDPINAYIGDASGFTSTRSSAAYSINQWSHVCGVFASSTSRTVYINGSNEGSTTTSRTPVAFNRINIGVYRQGGSGAADAFNGRIAQIAVYNKALSASEVVSLSKGFSARLVAPNSLKVFVPLTRGFLDYKESSFSQEGTVSVIENPRIYA
jgi:hypothetical protein